jgi:hypothetical protein
LHNVSKALKEPKVEGLNGEKPFPIAKDRQALIADLNNDLAGEEIERIIAGWYEVGPAREQKENFTHDIGG